MVKVCLWLILHLNLWMKSIISLIALTLVAADNAVLVFKPLDTKTDLEEKLLVLIPGADVATEFYTNTANSI